MNQATLQVLQAIANEILALASLILEDDSISANRKTNANTLRDSALKKNMESRIASTENPVVIEILFNHYIGYIENGRQPMQGKKPPVDALRDWALSRGLPADNDTLFAISHAIWRDGYEGRPVLASLEKEIGECFEKRFFEQLFQSIIDELINYFN